MTDEVISEMVGGCMLMRTRLISRVLTGVYDELFAPFGINSPQFALLAGIWHLAPASRAEIGRYTHLDRSTLTRNIQLLISGGWIEEVQREKGRRVRALVLTKAGIDVLHDVAPAWREAQSKARDVLGERGVATVMDIGNVLLD